MVNWRNPLTEDEKKNWKEFSVLSKSGATLSGLYAITDNPKATIVLGHPMGKEAKGYFLKNGYTDLLLSNGYNVIIFDINGFGESSMGNFSFYEDIVSISKKAKELFPNLQIGYHGISLGGQYATISFADDSHCYDFAIIESAPTTLDEFWIHFPFAYKALKLFNVFMPKYKTKINMVERIKEAKRFEMASQIFRSGTSIGANTREAQNAESKADFVHKLKIALKEADETEYWLFLCNEHDSYPYCPDLLNDLSEILKILNKIIATTKGN